MLCCADSQVCLCLVSERAVTFVSFTFVNNLSDGMRRRCQLLELLATPRSVYLLDEISSDLDIFAREGVLRFLRAESEQRGATIFYCTPIFDHLEGWASHLLYLSKGGTVRACPMEEVEDYAQLISNGDNTPLYSLFRRWILTNMVPVLMSHGGSSMTVSTDVSRTWVSRAPSKSLAHNQIVHVHVGSAMSASTAQSFPSAPLARPRYTYRFLFCVSYPQC